MRESDDGRKRPSASQAPDGWKAGIVGNTGTNRPKWIDGGQSRN